MDQMWYLSWRDQAAKIHNTAAFKYWWVSVERAITSEMMDFGGRVLKSEIYNSKLNEA